MPFRITPQSIYARSLYDMTNSFGRLADAEVAISSTKRIRVFSDDASGASRALDLRTVIQRTIQSRSSIDDGQRAADTQAEVLNSASDLIAQARALGESGASDGKTDSDLKSLATEVDSILDQLVASANQRVEGRYLFAGSKTETKPFNVTRSFGKVTAVSYAGDDIVRRVRLGPGEEKEIELSGSQAFLHNSRETTVLVGGTGLAGTPVAQDTMIGNATILIAHTSSVFGDGLLAGGDSVSGLKLGTSTALDTIVGAAGQHKITIASDGSGGRTIRLDDGDPVAFTGTETDLALTSEGSDTVHVDLTSLSSTFTGSIDLTGNGTIQVKGGPSQALTFQSDFVLQDKNGRVVHLDTTHLVHGGETFAVFPGTESIFDAMIGLRDELEGATGLDPDQQVARIQARLAAIDGAHSGVLAGLSTLGARSASFQRVSGSLDFFELQLEDKRGELEDTDVFKASIQLTESQSAYSAALQATAKISGGPTLLNYL